jgi:hypothetical protein
MKPLLNNFENRSFKTIIIICLILFGCVSCIDNATKLAKQLETASNSILIVYQEGDINFTTYFRRFIIFDEIKVIYGLGTQKIVTEKVNNSKKRIVQVVFKEK